MHRLKLSQSLSSREIWNKPVLCLNPDRVELAKAKLQVTYTGDRLSRKEKSVHNFPSLCLNKINGYATSAAPRDVCLV